MDNDRPVRIGVNWGSLDKRLLSELMDENQPLSPQQTVEIMTQVCDALIAAGRIADPDEPGRICSLVHHDLNPDNIIIDTYQVKMLRTP